MNLPALYLELPNFNIKAPKYLHITFSWKMDSSFSCGFLILFCGIPRTMKTILLRNFVDIKIKKRKLSVLNTCAGNCMLRNFDF